jgi:hypothetical protein
VWRDRKDELDLADIGGETGTTTHGASIAGPGRRPKRLDTLARPCKSGNVSTRGRTKSLTDRYRGLMLTKNILFGMKRLTLAGFVVMGSL